jgi:cytochrome d ubiquinol oxidase subunit I
LPFIAILSGWVTAEVGRQPWVVYGVLRTADGVTPFLSAQTVMVSLAVYCVVYTFIFTFGTYYIYRLLRTGPVGSLGAPPIGAVPNRPMSVINEQRATPTSRHVPAGE